MEARGQARAVVAEAEGGVALLGVGLAGDGGGEGGAVAGDGEGVGDGGEVGVLFDEAGEDGEDGALVGGWGGVAHLSRPVSFFCGLFVSRGGEICAGRWDLESFDGVKSADSFADGEAGFWWGESDWFGLLWRSDG